MIILSFRCLLSLGWLGLGGDLGELDGLVVHGLGLLSAHVLVVEELLGVVWLWVDIEAEAEEEGQETCERHKDTNNLPSNSVATVWLLDISLD